MQKISVGALKSAIDLEFVVLFLGCKAIPYHAHRQDGAANFEIKANFKISSHLVPKPKLGM
jgi:hypothetical protein